VTQNDRLNMLKQVLAAGVEPDTQTPDCLDDDTIAALAEGSLDAGSRSSALAHVASCARCRRAVASVARALTDRSVARALGSAAWGRRRFLRIALPTAAAAVLLLLSWPSSPNEGESEHRAPPAPRAAPVPISPMGPVAEAQILRWTAVSGADRYRVTLFDVQGRVLFEAQVSDTMAMLPDSLTLVRGQAYLWKIEARTGFDRWSPSELVEFSIGGAAPR